MKRENYEEVKEIISKIESLEEELKLLNFTSVNVRIKYYDSSGADIIKIFPTNEGTLSKLTANYIDAIKAYYETEIKILSDKLETL